jgi:hypothetical protein
VLFWKSREGRPMESVAEISSYLWSRKGKSCTFIVLGSGVCINIKHMEGRRSTICECL